MSNQGDQTRLNSLYSLKTILNNSESYDKLAVYARAVDGIFERAGDRKGTFITQAVATGMEPVASKEDDVVNIINQLQNHMSTMENIGTSKRIEEIVMDAGKSRYQLDKVTVNILEGYSAAIRGYCTASHTIYTMTDNKLDVLDNDQLNIVEQTYCEAFQQFDRLRQVCTDASKVYSSSTLLSRAFGSLSNFVLSLFSNLVVNATDLKNEVQCLKNFNEIFNQLEPTFKKTQNEISVTKNEISITRNITEFSELFAKLHDNYEQIDGHAQHLKRLFVEINEDELTDAYDYMVMVKEVFAIFTKILDERLNNGYADLSLFRELENNLEDKPETLVTLGANFRSAFS